MSEIPATPFPIMSVNGERCSELSGLERGLAYGDGLFETLLVHRGRPPYLPAHWERLAEGVKRLQLPVEWLELNRQLKQFLEPLNAEQLDGVLKAIVTRGADGRGYRPADKARCTYVFIFFPGKPALCAPEPIDLCSLKHRLPTNPVLAGIKHLNKLDYVLASLEWDQSRFQEALLYDQDDGVVEALSRNVFALIDDQLVTPPLNHAGVKGVMRRMIMEQYGAALDVSCREARLTRNDLITAGEVFLCNSISGIWPVRSIDGDLVSIGNIAARLDAIIRDDFGNQCRRAATFVEDLA